MKTLQALSTAITTFDLKLTRQSFENIASHIYKMPQSKQQQAISIITPALKQSSPRFSEIKFNNNI